MADDARSRFCLLKSEPSAPALPVFRTPTSDAVASNLPTELRLIVEEFNRLRTYYEEKVVVVPPPEPCYWRESGADVIENLEISKANKLLAHGRTIKDAASVIAAGLLTREHGAHKTRTALRAR